MNESGLSLTYILSWIKTRREAGFDIDEMTTQQVVEDIIVPLTRTGQKISYIEHVQKGVMGYVVKPLATHFVSHAWEDKFVSVIECVRNSVAVREMGQENVFLWVDMFSVNQHHRVTTIHDADFFYTTLQELIRKIGHTVLTIPSWKSPTVFMRSWCLWEMYGTIRQRHRLTFALETEDEKDLGSSMRNDFKAVISRLCKVDVAQARASAEDDRKGIRVAIEKYVGMRTIDFRILSAIREWLLQLAKDQLQESMESDKETEAELLRGIGLLNKALGYLGLSLDAFTKAIRIRKSLPRTEQNSVAIAVDLFVLSSIQFKLDMLREGLDAMKESLEIYEKVVSIGGVLASTFKNLSLSDVAKTETMDFETPGDSVKVDTALLELYQGKDEPEKTREVLEATLATKLAMVEDNHPDIGLLYNMLAQNSEDLGAFEDADLYLERSLAIHQEAYGDLDPNTIQVMERLGELEAMKRPVNMSKLVSRFEEVLKAKKKVYGDFHIMVIRTEARLDELKSECAVVESKFDIDDCSLDMVDIETINGTSGVMETQSKASAWQARQLRDILKHCNYSSSVEERIVSEIGQALREFSWLVAKVGRSRTSDGNTASFLCLEGTIPTNYNGKRYNISTVVWIPHHYPLFAPMVYLIPNATIAVKPDHPNVNQGGLVSVQYMNDWDSSNSNLLGLLQVLRAIFSDMPPMYSTRKRDRQINDVLGPRRHEPD
eukprot:CAMPEP_0184697210 /NCGR_PEP_ID=MMETSP0313-20130426/4241_1 /TAXON_ID=2792 /ORGANISM="Porphyridium aerugineum, Strain SAG 1380-2" /LENGTH=716 /DNA_ID=CAMNT_0027155975 /DNA_START=160 /DNA_END=2310 /DNA_ORIENTATION=-